MGSGLRLDLKNGSSQMQDGDQNIVVTQHIQGIVGNPTIAMSFG